MENISIDDILLLAPPLTEYDFGEFELSLFFQQKYVKVAEAISQSYYYLTKFSEPMSEISNYLQTSLDGNIRVVVDIVTDISFSEDISEVDFVLNLSYPSYFSWKQCKNISYKNYPYSYTVKALNDFTIKNVLGEKTTNPYSVNGYYSDSLRDFINIDCYWGNPSSSNNEYWLELCRLSGYDV